MPHPNVTAIFPSFDDPDHFERTMTGRYICKLCPQGDRLQRTFNTDKAALAHERSTDHIYYAELEKNNPWNAEPGADSAGWGSDAAIEQLLTTEEVKDLEYRKRVSDLPDTIEKWRAGFLTFARDDAMLPVDEPPQSRRKSRRNKAVKNANTSTESKVEQASETVLPGVWQPVKSIATSSIEGRDVRSRPPVSHFHIHNISTSTASSRPTVDAARIPMRRKPHHLFFNIICLIPPPLSQRAQKNYLRPLPLN